MSREKLVWYAPTWSTAPKQWWALRKHLLSFGPLARISIASLTAVALVLMSFKIAFPAIVFPNLLPVLLTLPMLVAMLTLQTYLHSFFKARVIVTRKKIIVSHGASATIIKPEWLTHVILAIHADDHVRIRFCYEVQGKSKFKTIGISDDLDLKTLGSLLPVKIIPKDYRRRIIA